MPSNVSESPSVEAILGLHLMKVDSRAKTAVRDANEQGRMLVAYLTRTLYDVCIRELTIKGAAIKASNPLSTENVASDLVKFEEDFWEDVRTVVSTIGGSGSAAAEEVSSE